MHLPMPMTMLMPMSSIAILRPNRRASPPQRLIGLATLALLITLVALAASPIAAKSLTGDRVLAVVDSSADKLKYSQLFKLLSDRGFKIDYFDPTSSPPLFDFGERAYDHALVLANPTRPLKDHLSPTSLVSFLRSGGNLLLGVAPGVSDAHKDFVYELGIDLADTASPLRDVFQADPQDPTLLAANGWTSEDTLVPAAMRHAGVPVVYRGVAHTLVPRASADGGAPEPEIVFPILSASPTAKGQKAVEGSGEQLHLVSGVQATNGARAVVLGSLDMLTDEFFAKKVAINKPLPPLRPTQSSFPVSSNRAFADEVLKWVLHEKSIVRIARVSHHKQGEVQQQDMYRIKDTLVVNVTLQEYHVDHWMPYLLPVAASGNPGAAVAPAVVFSAKMLDPYLRQPMPLVFTSATEATYSLTTRLPDTYGVFTFAVDHVRRGLAPVHHAELVSIRPFRHDEYPRWLPVAMPYYVASVSQMLAGVVLVGLWITRKHVPAVGLGAAAAEKKAEAAGADRRDADKAAVATGVAAAPATADASPSLGKSGAQRRKKKN